MKRFWKICGVILPHLILILSLMILTFFVIDRINESMYFLENDATKWIAAVLALLSATLSVVTVVKATKKHPLGEDKKDRKL